MNLYDITHEYRAQLDALAELELDPQTVQDTLEGLQGDIEAKLQAVIAYSLELDILAEGAKEHADRMQARAKALANRVQWLREYSLQAMQQAGIPAVETPEFSAKPAKKPAAVSIVDAAAIPPAFMRVPEPPAPAPDKAAIAAAWKAGQEVPGTALTQGWRLSIR